jgi:hypothetical protein
MKGGERGGLGGGRGGGREGRAGGRAGGRERNLQSVLNSGQVYLLELSPRECSFLLSEGFEIRSAYSQTLCYCSLLTRLSELLHFGVANSKTSTTRMRTH